MDELDLRILERRVDELIRTVERLRDENRLLRNSNAELLAERTRLIERTELARSRVEAMISRLKGMEQES
ncbi:MAG: TIGR02449 family protein [Thiohalomonadaceae bacterium]